MKIKVKKTHIQRGKQDEPTCCAIALALQEAFGVDVRVEKDEVKIGKKTLPLPQNAQDFIENFDSLKSSVKPFEFEL